MRVRKLLALTIAIVLVLGTFTFGYGTEEVSETNSEVEEPVQNPDSGDQQEDAGKENESNSENDNKDNEDEKPIKGDDQQESNPEGDKTDEKDENPSKEDDSSDEEKDDVNTDQTEPKGQEKEKDLKPEDPDGLRRPVEIKSPELERPRQDLSVKVSSLVENFSVMTRQVESQPGDIFVNKTATKLPDECNLWEIELTLTGHDGEQTSDTVLVIDRSGSMSGNKFTEAIDAAKNFVDLIFDGTNDSNHRIAVVSFAGDVDVEINFSSNKVDIKAAIDGIASPSGGTHTQAGLKQAGILIDPSTADSQNVVLLSDGEATYSYEINNPNIYATDEFNPDDWIFDTDYRTTFSVPESAFNYSDTVGDGTSGHTIFEDGPWNGIDRYYRHGASAVAEAGFIKNGGTTIYTISLDNNTEGEWTLDNIADPGNNYTTSGGDLEDIYQEIAGNIVYAATNAVITDPLGPLFDIPGINGSNYNSLITVSRGSLAWDDTNEVITWTLGNISASDPATMTYTVEMDPSGFGQGLKLTNGDTYVEYINIYDESDSKDFPIPEVESTCQPPQDYGTLTIEKEVWIDRVEDTDNDTVFTFSVNGETVTASAVIDGQIRLPVDTYLVEETDFGGFTPDTVTQQAVVTTEGATVTFVNRYTTPPGNIKIIKNIEIEDEAVHEGVRFNLSPLANGDGVLSGYTDSNGELIFNNLPVGDYLLEEVVPLDFETTYTTQVAVTPGQTTEIKVLNNMVENPADQFVYNGSSIYGYKYNAMEEVLQGWTIELYEEGNSTTPVATTVTNSDGFYEFNGVDEGVYVIKEVMQDGWYNITPIQQTITIGAVGFDEETLHFSDDQSLIAALPDSNIEFVAEGRIGDMSGNATHELNIHTPTYNIEDDFWNFDWRNNGVPVPFELDYDGSTVTFTVDGEELTYANVTPGQITDMIIRTRATENNSGIMVNNLYLDGQPVGDNSVAVANGNGRDILWLREFDLTDGFTLTGQSVMYWTDEFEPSQSKLAYQIKLGHALHQDEYWANPFMNDEYADVTVYKEINGEQVDTDFNFRIYEGTGTGGAIVAQTSVDINNPEFIGGLEPGTYTIGEQPVEGYITPQPYTFDIEAGESLDLTLRNIEIVPQPEPSMIIEKVADDYSVYVGEDVTYTITVTNTGDVDLDYVYVTDDELGYSENVNIPAGGSFSHSITTSYDSTGTKENTARAEYGIETNDYFMVEDTVEVEVNRRTTPSGTYRMTIEKEALLDEVVVGELVEFTITVENTGNRTLTNIELVDDMTGLDETITLSPGESETFNVSVVAEEVGTLTNTAQATHDRASFVQDSDSVNIIEDEEELEDEDIPEGEPGTFEMTIEKTALVEGEIFFGDMVEFTIVVTNSGDEILENILVEDDMVDFEAVIEKLEPGESEEFTVNVAAPNVPGPFTNTARATNTETGTQQADDTVFVEEPVPLDVPDTGVAPTHLFFGLGALVSGLGVFFTKKRK
jgi:LPXTG-motif cell wall-anchored protein